MAGRLIRPELGHAGFWLGIGIAYVAVIVWLSLMPHPPQPFQLWDKAAHFLVYATLAGWFGAVIRRSAHVLVVVLVTALGVVLEFVQGWSGLRQFELADMTANGLGALAGVLVALTPVGNTLIRIERLWRD